MICKYLLSWVKKTSLTKNVATFKNCCFPNFSGENNITKLGRSLLIPCSLSDERMLLLNTNFSTCKLIID